MANNPFNPSRNTGSPCLGCQNRNAECHGNCQAYLEYWHNRRKERPGNYVSFYSVHRDNLTAFLKRRKYIK